MVFYESKCKKQKNNNCGINQIPYQYGFSVGLQI